MYSRVRNRFFKVPQDLIKAITKHRHHKETTAAQWSREPYTDTLQTLLSKLKEAIQGEALEEELTKFVKVSSSMNTAA